MVLLAILVGCSSESNDNQFLPPEWGSREAMPENFPGGIPNNMTDERRELFERVRNGDEAANEELRNMREAIRGDQATVESIE